MKFELKFNMDNADFENEPEYAVEAILVDVAGRVIDGLTAGMIFDVNGNDVGDWEIIAD